MSAIHAIDSSSIHKITSGQVVVDLQTAVKELLENSIDAGSTSIEIRFKEWGLKSIEVVDNGSGIASTDYSSIALKHHTSKLSKYEDLLDIQSFGFRGEALASLCALSETVNVTTATKEEAPMGTVLEFDQSGTLTNSTSKTARQRGTTTTVEGLFIPLPVRRHELTRNIKREFSKALALLNAYALYPCVTGSNIVRLTVSNQTEAGKKTVQFQTNGAGGILGSISKLWGPKATENIIKLSLTMTVQPEASQLRRNKDQPSVPVTVDGYISAFAHGRGRASNDRQFFYINGRPCTLPKIQKALNEVYKTFNTNQYPFVVANFVLPLDAYDVNVSPDKRTLFLHNEVNLVLAFRAALEAEFSSARSTFIVNSTAADDSLTKLNRAKSSPTSTPKESEADPEKLDEDVSDREDPMIVDDIVSKSLFIRSPTPEVSRPESSTMAAGLSPEDTMAKSPQGLNEEDASNSIRSRKKPRLSDSANMSADKDDLSPSPTPEPSVSLTTTPFVTKVSTNIKPLAAVSIRASPPPSARALTTGSGVRVHTIPQGKGVQLTLKQTLNGFVGPGAKVATNSKPSRVPRASEISSEEEDELVDDLPEPSAHSKLSSAHEDEVMKLKAPVATPPRMHRRSRDSRASNRYSPQSGPTSFPSEERAPSLEIDSKENDEGTPVEIMRSTEARHVKASFNFVGIASRWKQQASAQKTSVTTKPMASSPDVEHSPGTGDAGVGNTVPEEAEKALSRIISKDDFCEGAMSVVGQFNLGFIVARLDKNQSGNGSTDSHDDLFIIDQHASDEKFNFETLQQTTKIQSQSLLRPRALELAASDEVTAIDGLDVLKANGFEVSFTEDAPVGQRLHLVSQPQSKSTSFDMRDLEELLSLMQDYPPGHMVRSSKARAMFASRACRKSVMVGKPLTSTQMTSIVRQMATLDQPWSCPHGRPTMRHLADLRGFVNRSTRAHQSRPIKWNSFELSPSNGAEAQDQEMEET